MSDKKYISKEGRQKLEEELKRLKYTDRPAIIADIKWAREMGDLSENAEYHAAKESQGHLERKISELEFTLSQVEMIDASEIPSDKVYLFASVKLKDLSDGEELTYTIVPAEEADVDRDMISVSSPIGAGLLGKAIGETAEIEVPAGTLKYQIIDISRE